MDGRGPRAAGLSRTARLGTQRDGVAVAEDVAPAEDAAGRPEAGGEGGRVVGVGSAEVVGELAGARPDGEETVPEGAADGAGSGVLESDGEGEAEAEVLGRTWNETGRDVRSPSATVRKCSPGAGSAPGVPQADGERRTSQRYTADCSSWGSSSMS